MGCGQSKSVSLLKRVVVVGGGYSGAYLARLLQQEDFCEVTLIDSSEAMFHSLAVPRCIVEPEFLETAFIPFRNFIKQHIQSSVVSINVKKARVELQNGKKVPYDFLVICSGTNKVFPLGLSDAKSEGSVKEAIDLYKSFNEAMKRSPDIVLLNGSQFAVELAGEIRTDYPDKKVSIIHDKNNLISEHLNVDLQAEIKRILDRKEVDLLLNTNATNSESLVCNKYEKEQKVKTADGREVLADLVVKCGDTNSYATTFCQSTLLVLYVSTEQSLNEDGRIQVDEYLRIKNSRNIFAIGSVNDVRCEKNHENAKLQAEVASSNIRAIALSLQELCTFQPASPSDMITFGRYGGAGFKDGKLLDEDDILELKSEDVFTKKTWMDLGLTAPL